MLSLEKENRMMGYMGTQVVFFKDDIKDALKHYHFSEEELKTMLNDGFVIREEAMNFEYLYKISSINVFNVERKNNIVRP